MATMNNAEKNRAAIHEAGHAVVAESLGYRCRMFVRADGTGACDIEEDVQPEHEPLISIAGHAAEAIYCKEDVEEYVAECFAADPPRWLGDIPINDSAKAGTDWRQHVPAAVAIIELTPLVQMAQRLL